MPTHTTNYTPDQYTYINSTKADDQSFSDRAREVTLMGMAVEQTDLLEAANIMEDEHEEFSPNAEDAIREVVRYYLNNHPEASDS